MASFRFIFNLYWFFYKTIPNEEISLSIDIAVSYDSDLVKRLHKRYRIAVIEKPYPIRIVDMKNKN